MSDDLTISEVIETAEKMTNDDLSQLIELVRGEATSEVGESFNARWQIILGELERIKKSRTQEYIQNPKGKNDGSNKFQRN